MPVAQACIARELAVSIFGPNKGFAYSHSIPQKRQKKGLDLCQHHQRPLILHWQPPTAPKTPSGLCGPNTRAIFLPQGYDLWLH